MGARTTCSPLSAGEIYQPFLSFMLMLPANITTDFDGVPSTEYVLLKVRSCYLSGYMVWPLAAIGLNHRGRCPCRKQYLALGRRIVSGCQADGRRKWPHRRHGRTARGKIKP